MNRSIVAWSLISALLCFARGGVPAALLFSNIDMDAKFALFDAQTGLLVTSKQNPTNGYLNDGYYDAASKEVVGLFSLRDFFAVLHVAVPSLVITQTINVTFPAGYRPYNNYGFVAYKGAFQGQIWQMQGQKPCVAYVNPETGVAYCRWLMYETAANYNIGISPDTGTAMYLLMPEVAALPSVTAFSLDDPPKWLPPADYECPYTPGHVLQRSVSSALFGNPFTPGNATFVSFFTGAESLVQRYTGANQCTLLYNFTDTFAGGQTVAVGFDRASETFFGLLLFGRGARMRTFSLSGFSQRQRPSFHVGPLHRAVQNSFMGFASLVLPAKIGVEGLPHAA